MTGALRPTLISLLLITAGVVALASYVESQHRAAPGRALPAAPIAPPVLTPAPAPAPIEAPLPAAPSARIEPPPSPPPIAPSPAVHAPVPAPSPAPIAALPPLPVPKPRAVEPLVAKARQGDAEAQFDLALAYAARGDWKHSAAWFREAAIAGLPEARLRLAEQYRLGRGLRTDPLEAFIWTKSAAEQGLPAAQLALGDAYERGLGVPVMPVDAYAWYDLAAEAGDTEAQHRRERLATSLSIAEREAGKARAITLAAALEPSAIPNRHLVAEIQRLLRAQGYDAGLDDGFRGERTAEAIRRYQEAKGLPVDGKPSDALLGKLRAAVRPPPPPPVE
jgi:localization factor PodJL